MSNGGIEDILIGDSYKSTKKSNKGFLFFLFFILIVGLGVAYYFYANTEKTVNAKAAFVEHLSNANIKEIANAGIYEDLRNRIYTENSETRSKINFTTTVENEKFSDLDFSKFTLNLLNQNDIKNDKIYGELGIDYSGNELITLKALSDNDKIAFFSDEIVNKYVGTHFKNMEELFGAKYDLTNFYTFRNAKNIKFTKEEQNSYFEKYCKLILNQIGEEKFSIKENYALENESVDDISKNIDVTAYTVELSEEELKEILISVLTNLRNDTDLLNEIIVEEEKYRNVELQTDTPVEENNELQENLEEPKENIEENEEENIEASEEGTEGEVLEENTETPGETENFQAPNEDITEGNDEVQDEEQQNIIEEENQKENQGVYLTPAVNPEENNNQNDEEIEIIQAQILEILNRILLGKKVDFTLEEIQKLIDDIIEKIKLSTGNGLTVTIYASEEKTEKISIVLPNKNTLEIKVVDKTDKQNSVDITYLYKGNNSSLGIMSNLESVDKSVNGFKINLIRKQDSANTTTKLVYNFIENEKINKKITVNIETDGTTNSKTFTNDIVITVSSEKGETKIVVDNKIKLSADVLIENLNDENCLFLETLTPEDLEATKVAIKDMINEVYEEKRENLKFIDKNIKPSIIDQDLENVANKVNYENIKNRLSNEINNMRNTAIENEEEFSIRDLENLQIDGYDLSVTVNENDATIVIGDYTFIVDVEFNITEAQ